MKAIKSDSDSDSDEQKKLPPRVSPTLVTPLNLSAGVSKVTHIGPIHLSKTRHEKNLIKVLADRSSIAKTEQKHSEMIQKYKK